MTCLATLVQTELNRLVLPLQPTYLLQDRFDVSGRTHNIAIQLVLQPCYKTSCTFFCRPFQRTLINEEWETERETSSPTWENVNFTKVTNILDFFALRS